MSSGPPFRILDLSRRALLRAFAAASGVVAHRTLAYEAPQFLRAPSVQNLSSTQASLLWTMASNAGASATITDSGGSSFTVPVSVTRFGSEQTGLNSAFYLYQAAFTGLKPGVSYSYQAQANGIPVTGSGCTQRFRTPDESPFQFLHFADSGEGNTCQSDLARQMAAENADLVLANGDLAYDLATFESVEDNYFSVYRDMMSRTPFFATLGNHEYNSDYARPALAGRALPSDGIPAPDRGRYYSFDWGNTHFIALDSNDTLAAAIHGDNGMLDWLERDLKATSQFWRIAFFHHPPYSTGKHRDEPEAGQVRQAIVPILERYGVQLVLNGHEHTYQRTYPLLGGEVSADAAAITYVTSGGGGAQALYYPGDERIALSAGVNHYLRVEVSGGALTVRAIAQGGSEIDSVRLAPRPRISRIVNPASWTESLGSGGLVTITGHNLSAAAAGGVSVTLEDTRLPLLYAGPGQINAQLPAGYSGTGRLVIATPNGSVEADIAVARSAPALFQDPDGRAIALHSDGSQVTAAAAARCGETVTLMVTGLGDPGTDVQVVFRYAVVNASSVSAAPGLAGVQQVAVTVPQDLPPGLIPIRIVASPYQGDAASLIVA